MMGRWTRLVPPGVNLRRELSWCGIALGGSTLWSLGYFLALLQARDCLYHWVGTELVLREGVPMADFGELVGWWLDGFVLTAVGAILFAGWHYLYHVQESKSIYLMRRLSDRWELHRRCLALPALLVAAALLLAVALLLAYYQVYFWVAPDNCILPGQWERFWYMNMGGRGLW